MDSDVWSRFRNQINKYKITAPGYKYNMTDIAASLGLAQMRSLEQRWKIRENHWHQYNAELRGMLVELPLPIEEQSRHAYHLYTILIDESRFGIDRDVLHKAMWEENIGTGIHYIPVHMQPYYQQRFGFAAEDLPESAKIGISTLSLPLNTDLTAADISSICDAIKKILSYFMNDQKKLVRAQNDSL